METIFALATPLGRSGVAVIRISGAETARALAHFGKHILPEPRKAIYHAFTINSQSPTSNPQSQTIDHGLLLYFPAPHSFTGEDCAEFQLHGSIAVLKRILSELSLLPGFREAEAGEFARRAFLNGKLDLTAAEGLADLIEAETEAQRRQANTAASGETFKYLSHLRGQILKPLALLEAVIDFPDEEIPPSLSREVVELVAEVKTAIAKTIDQSKDAEKIREGFTIVILGPPNVGKSTLLNCLVRREVAIVSDRAGTTRDLIETPLDMKGIPVVFIDTAGIRETEDWVESEGIRRALARAEHADLKLILLDGTQPLDTSTYQLVDAESLIIITKSDLQQKINLAELAIDKGSIFHVSAFHPETLIPLTDKIVNKLTENFSPTTTTPLTRQRHRDHLLRAINELEQFNQEISPELQCERLRRAAAEIGKITGVIQVDEVLDIIFSSFCIGK